MEHSALTQRPISRIDHVLSKLKTIWHYYPQYSLAELVLHITLTANEVESDFSETSMYDIEDISYPQGHYLHESRSLEMGIAALEKQHENEPLPPVPIQTALLGKVGEAWRKQPQMRLGQLLSNKLLKAELESDSE